MTETRTRTLGAILYPQFELLDLYGPLEMFGCLEPDVKIVTVAQQPGPVASTPGVETVATYGFDDCPPLDLMLLPGGIGTLAELTNERLLEFLRKRSEEGVAAPLGQLVEQPRVDLPLRRRARRLLLHQRRDLLQRRGSDLPRRDVGRGRRERRQGRQGKQPAEESRPRFQLMIQFLAIQMRRRHVASSWMSLECRPATPSCLNDSAGHRAAPRAKESAERRLRVLKNRLENG